LDIILIDPDKFHLKPAVARIYCRCAATMKRPVGVTVTSVLQILGSLLTLLMGALVFAVPLMQKGSKQTTILPAGVFYVSAFYVLMAVLGFATALGLWRIRRWARISTLIFAGFLVFFGLAFLVAGVFVPMPVPAGATASAQQGVAAAKAFLVCLAVALGGLGATWLYYFNRRPVKELFVGTGRSLPEGATVRPVSILTIGILILLGMPWMILGAWLGFPITFFGFLVHGRAASLIYLLFAVLHLYMGIGLLRLLPLSRIVTIAYYAYAAISGLLFWILPGRNARYQILMAESLRIWHIPTMSQSPELAPGMSFWFLMSAVGTAAISVAAIYFLVTRRVAFERCAMAVPTPDKTLPSV
jgi:hypothetical protein